MSIFSLLWLDLFRQLSYEWSTNAQYSYGWVVPFLALGLLWKRFSSRPAQQPVESPAWMVLLVAAAAFALLPIRVVHEINQDWPLFTWPLAIGVVLISLYGAFLTGGWPWVKHFAFPICFILVAVKWPYRLEDGLTHGLMRGVVGLTVQVLGSLDVMAFQRGNLIELSTGVVGIDEACSGIRSFQSTLMAALFLGELYRFRWAHRLGLLFSGVLLAFFWNVIRTLILTWHASSSGLEALEKWHDPAGIIIFLICFVCLWFVALVIRKKGAFRLFKRKPKPKYRATVTTGESQHLSPALEPAAFNDQPVPSFLRLLFSSPRVYLVGMGSWALFVFGATEIWYRSHDIKMAQPVHWWLSSPSNMAGFHEVSITESARKLLNYDQGATASWKEADGSQWSAYCLRWRPGNATARMSALGHRPEYCLTGSGHELRAELGTKYFAAGELELPFRAYIFDDPQHPLHVFFCLWEDGSEKQLGFGRSKYLDRLRSVLNGRRGLGQQTFEIAVSGYPTIADAERALRTRLAGLIHVEISSGDRPRSKMPGA